MPRPSNFSRFYHQHKIGWLLYNCSPWYTINRIY
jgi:hypothetical protein